MDFFEGFGKKVSEAVDTVGKKAEESIEVQKLKNQISTLERKNEKDYIELGKIVYQKFQTGSEVDATSLTYCEEINRRDIVIGQCKKDIADKKGMEECKVCGAAIEKGSLYCNQCGAKIGE